MKILVVDSEQELRQLLQQIFTEAGYDVRTAQDGYEALKLWQQYLPDIVITDKANNMDGHSFVQTLRQQGYSGLAVMFTGYSCWEPGFFSDCVRAGIDLLIEKPATAELLLSSIAFMVQMNISSRPKICLN
jgi:CheY-like chemotaxis protein